MFEEFHRVMAFAQLHHNQSQAAGRSHKANNACNHINPDFHFNNCRFIRLIPVAFKMELCSDLILFFLFLSWMVCVRIFEAVRKYPPSCMSVPLLGRVPMIALRAWRDPHSNFYRELSRDGVSKGDVWSTFLGQRRIIGLTSYEAIYDALSRQGHDFAWRPRREDFTEYFNVDGEHSGDPARVGGILLSSGDLWREQRRFALSVLRDLGMGKNITERRIQMEASCLQEELREMAGRPFEPNPILTRTVSNVICQFVFGFRANAEDYEFQKFNQMMKKIFQEGNSTVFLSLLVPALENTFISRYFSKPFAENEKKMIAIIADKVSQVESQLTNLDDEPEHFVAAFLQKQRNEPENSTFSKRQLVFTVYDLFLAGSETTSTFLNWAFLYLAVHQDWQEQLHKEIDEELGNLNDISYNARLRCHKAMAFIDEIHRHACIVPHNGPHAVAKETIFRGFRIPADAMIIPDIESVHHDPKLWPDPQQFDPSRFLNESGEYETSKFLIPFSLGKRVCLGEGLARMEIFIFLTSILRGFAIDLDEEAKRLKGDIFIGSALDINCPGNHKVILTARQHS